VFTEKLPIDEHKDVDAQREDGGKKDNKWLSIPE
jgi:hypothetical protein